MYLFVCGDVCVCSMCVCGVYMCGDVCVPFRSKQCLDDWREETRRRQGGGMENSKLVHRLESVSVVTHGTPNGLNYMYY